MRGFLRNTALLYALWILLSGRSEPLFLIVGLLASAGIAGLQAGHPGPPNPTIPLREFLLYIPWLLSRIVVSNLRTTSLILNPRMPIQPRLIRYRPELRDPAALALLAISITLTPGTVMVEINSDELVVHALDDASAEDITNRRFEDKIRRIFKSEASP